MNPTIQRAYTPEYEIDESDLEILPELEDLMKNRPKPTGPVVIDISDDEDDECQAPSSPSAGNSLGAMSRTQRVEPTPPKFSPRKKSSKFSGRLRASNECHFGIDEKDYGHDDYIHSNNHRLRSKSPSPKVMNDGPGHIGKSACEAIVNGRFDKGEVENSQESKTKFIDDCDILREGFEVPSLIELLDLRSVRVIKTKTSGTGAEHIFQFQTSLVSTESISAAGDSNFQTSILQAIEKFTQQATRLSSLRGTKRKRESC